jgi:hypothetical protein
VATASVSPRAGRSHIAEHTPQEVRAIRVPAVRWMLRGRRPFSREAGILGKSGEQSREEIPKGPALLSYNTSINYNYSQKIVCPLTFNAD